MHTMGPANVGVILLLYRGLSSFRGNIVLSCDPVGTTQLVLYREVKCTISTLFAKDQDNR